MKKMSWSVLCLCALLLLSGCGRAAPPKAADGTDWSGDWVTLGNVIAVDTPEGLTARENSDVRSAKGMYYAAWSAQVYLRAAGHDSTQKAEERAAEWLNMAYEQYAVDAEAVETCNGQEFTVIIYTYTSETNPYTYGASAFGAYGNYALSVELSCRESFEGDALDTLTVCLEHCHSAT